MLRVSQRIRAIVGVAAALTLMTLGTGVASATPAQTTTTHHTWYVYTGDQSPDGAIMGMVYLPGTITVDVGDTVTWVGNSAEPHTVTFNATNPSPFAPATPGGSFDGTTYKNSGPMTNEPQSVTGFPSAHSYSLTFTKSGTFHYKCLFHPGMMGAVKVNPAGTAYPETQQQYDTANRIQTAQIIGSGYRLMGQEYAQSNNHLVYMGGTDMATGADVMRFIRPVVVIHAGESVTFENMSMEPHSVTIGSDAGRCNGDSPACDYGNTSYNPATGTYHSTYSSGYFYQWVDPMVAPDHTLVMTFTTPGTYQYYCALHDYMGMMGTVIVLP